MSIRASSSVLGCQGCVTTALSYMAGSTADFLNYFGENLAIFSRVESKFISIFIRWGKSHAYQGIMNKNIYYSILGDSKKLKTN